jgi:hypothetical protein
LQILAEGRGLDRHKFQPCLELLALESNKAVAARLPENPSLWAAVVLGGLTHSQLSIGQKAKLVWSALEKHLPAKPTQPEVDNLLSPLFELSDQETRMSLIQGLAVKVF